MFGQKNRSKKIVNINNPDKINVSEVKKELNNARLTLINNYLLANCVSKNLPLKLFMKSLEEELIQKALRIAKGNQRIASKILGMKATTLNVKIKKYDIKDYGKYKIQIELFHLFKNKNSFKLSTDQK